MAAGPVGFATGAGEPAPLVEPKPAGAGAPNAVVPLPNPVAGVVVPLLNPPVVGALGVYVVPAPCGKLIVGPAAPPNFSCVRPYALIPITAPIAM